MDKITYRCNFTVDFEMTVPAEAVTRVLENQDGWQDQFYKLDEDGVVEMIGRCCVLQGSPLQHLDGWGDMKPESSVIPLVKVTHERYELEEWERVSK